MDMNVLLMPILENRVACNPYLAPTTGDLGEPLSASFARGVWLCSFVENVTDRILPITPCTDEVRPSPSTFTILTSSFQLHGRKVILKQLMHKAIATADALKQATFNTVVEETGVVPGNFAVLGEDEAETEVLDAG